MAEANFLLNRGREGEQEVLLLSVNTWAEDTESVSKCRVNGQNTTGTMNLNTGYPDKIEALFHSAMVGDKHCNRCWEKQCGFCPCKCSRILDLFLSSDQIILFWLCKGVIGLVNLWRSLPTWVILCSWYSVCYLTTHFCCARTALCLQFYS